MNAHAMYTSVQQGNHNDFISKHAKLVKRIAFHMLSRLPPNVQVEDLIQSGMIGLLEANRHYDSSQGASFDTYAGIRIRGAMLDEIRKSDWTPRSVHRKAREASEVLRKLEQKIGRDAKDCDVAEKLDISLKDYHKILKESLASRVFSLDQTDESQGDREYIPEDKKNRGPMSHIHREGFFNDIKKEIGNLPERESLVMSLYYNDELNLREIGAVLGVSESRVCQIHGQALIRLRARLGDWVK